MASGALASIMVSITADISDFMEGLAQCSKAAKDFGEAGGIIAGAGVAILGSLTAMAEETGKFGASLELMSQKTGMSTETLSALKVAADASGSSIDQMTTAFRKVATDAESAAAGNQKMVDLFKSLGVSVTDSNGHLKDMDALFPELLDSLGNVGNSTQLTADAVALFGRSGMDLIPVIKEMAGDGGMQGLSDKAQALGVSVTQSQAQQDLAFQRSQEEAEKAFSGITMAIGQMLLPALTELAQSIASHLEDVRKWVSEYPQVTQLVVNLGLALVGGGGLLLGIAAVTSAVGFLSTALGGLAAGLTIMTGGVGAAIAIVYTFRNEWAELVTYLGSEVVGAFSRVLGVIADVAGKVGLGGLHDSLEMTKFNMEELSKDMADQSEQFSHDVVVIGETAKTHDLAAAAAKAHAAQLEIATEAAKKFQDGVNSIIDSVTEEIKKGPELVAALEQMTNAHTNDSLIVDKLSTKILALTDAMIKQGTSLGPVLTYYRDLAIARDVDVDETGRQFDAAVKIGEITEKNTGSLHGYLNAQSTSVIQGLTKDWQSHYDTLDQLMTKYIGATKDEAGTRIQLIKDMLAADTTYAEKARDLATSTEQIRAASFQAEADARRAIDTLELMQNDDFSAAEKKAQEDLVASKIKTWQEYNNELTNLEKQSSADRQRYEQQFFTSQDQAMQKMTLDMSKAFGDISTGLATTLTDDLIHWKNFGDSLEKLGQDIASKMLNAFLTGLFNPLTNQLESIGKSLGDAISNAISGSSGGGGFFGTLSSIIGGIIGFFDEGTAFVPQTGLAVVHQGERIITAADNAKLMNGGAISIPSLSNSGAPSVAQSNVSVTGSDMTQTNTLLATIARLLAQPSQANIYMDTTKVGTALYKGSRFSGLQVTGAQ